MLGPPRAPEPLPEQMSSFERAAGEVRAAPAARRPGEDDGAWEGGSAATAHGPQPLSPGGHALLMRILWLFSRLAPADRILCSLFPSSSTSRRRLKLSVGVTEVRSYLKLSCIHLRKKVPPGQWCVEGDLNSLVKIAPDMQAQWPWLMGPAAPRHVGSSRTGARTRVPCIGRRTLNHCTTREAQVVWSQTHSISEETKREEKVSCLFGSSRVFPDSLPASCGTLAPFRLSSRRQPQFSPCALTEARASASSAARPGGRADKPLGLVSAARHRSSVWGSLRFALPRDQDITAFRQRSVAAILPRSLEFQ
ncbi:uncharacterized protein LOC132484243 isoform X2 [Mesoplodon densirostris]|uniref:uncharacterized protein LOC132484243 isoform X2 n=1 Tax=Mesoplodon densirostris TaxID=48708 RepID=UPI0028DCF5D7|nr:uncharacterized protein LOC132484243 isoform X2 [Mesoplodon densirostris]